MFSPKVTPTCLHWLQVFVGGNCLALCILLVMPCSCDSVLMAALMAGGSMHPFPEVSSKSIKKIKIYSMCIIHFVVHWAISPLPSPSGCGGFLHTDRGVLSSPQYPQNYKSNLNCNWQVLVTPGFRVSVTFQSPFQIQGFGTQCSTGDYLEVSDYRRRRRHFSKTEPVHYTKCPFCVWEPSFK